MDIWLYQKSRPLTMDRYNRKSDGWRRMAFEYVLILDLCEQFTLINIMIANSQANSDHALEVKTIIFDQGA